jgi:hypothetical protein
MEDNLDYTHALGTTRVYEPQRVKLTVNDLRKMIHWIDSEGVENTAVVEIMVSSSSGIGQGIEAKIETGKGQGVWKDFTDYESW